EGVAWFGDPNQGGPVDDDLEVKIEVTAADPVLDSGAPDDDAGTNDDGGPISVSQIPVGGEGGDEEMHPPVTSSNDEQDGAKSGGCSIDAAHESSRDGFVFAFAGVLAIATKRRRSRRAG
ncbi:MAG: hypothetical protein ABI461_11075, partial [Polyangiaceae bacterium]